MKHYAVPTTYHSEDDNETSGISVYFVKALNPQDAKVITMDVITQEESALYPENDELSNIWFEHSIEGINNNVGEEGIIIGEPQEIPQLDSNGRPLIAGENDFTLITDDNYLISHPDGNQSTIPYWVRQRLSQIDTLAQEVNEFFEDDFDHQIPETWELTEKLAEISHSITTVQENEGWI